MTVNHRIARKLQTGDYNMDYFTFEISVDDIPQSVRKDLTSFELWSIMQFVVQREGLRAQLMGSLMDSEEYRRRAVWLQDLLNPKLMSLVESHGL